MAPTLRGDHCQCPTCGESFNSTSAFDKHRVGPYTHDLTTRRCLSPAEMRVAGMATNAAGWWIVRVQANALARASKMPIVRGQSCVGDEISATPYPTSPPLTIAVPVIRNPWWR
jgi:hypothetical protein